MTQIAAGGALEQALVQPKAPPMLTVHRIPAAFSEIDCDRIIDLSRTAHSADARLVGRNQDHNLRRADLVWLDDVAGAELTPAAGLDVTVDADLAVGDRVVACVKADYFTRTGDFSFAVSAMRHVTRCGKVAFNASLS